MGVHSRLSNRENYTSATKKIRYASTTHGSCRAAKKCCDGKDTDCEVKFDPNSSNIIFSPNSESCYCDHGCLDMGDCCPDYKEYCEETAMILPGKFSQITNEVQESNVYDVRQNLKTFHREENTDEYCVVFRVEKAMKSCKLNEDTNTLIRGADICVSCESKSTRPHLGDRCSGHGVEDRITRFKNVITPGCHGKWIKTGVYDKCPCHGGPNFIFV